MDVVTTIILKACRRSGLSVGVGREGLVTLSAKLSSPAMDILRVFRDIDEEYTTLFREQGVFASPLITMNVAGSDNQNLENIDIDLSSAKTKPELFKLLLDKYEEYIRSLGPQVNEELSSLNTRIMPGRREFSIGFGLRDTREKGLRSPVALLRESFYELGKVHGIRDVETVSGRPKYGVVEVRCSPAYALMLYLSLLSCEVVGEVGPTPRNHIFLTIHIEPGSTINADVAGALDMIYEDVKYGLSRLGRSAIDYFNHVNYYAMFSAYCSYLGNKTVLMPLAGTSAPLIGLRIHLLQNTGRRFLRLSDIMIRLYELNTLDMIFSGMGFDEKAKNDVAKTLYLALGASMRLASITGERAFERVIVDLGLLSQAFMDGSYRYAIDVAYRLARTVVEGDVWPRLVGGMANMASEEAQRAGVKIEAEAVKRDLAKKLFDVLGMLSESIARAPHR